PRRARPEEILASRTSDSPPDGMPADEITTDEWNGERGRQDDQGQADDAQDAEQPDVGRLRPDDVTSDGGLARAKMIRRCPIAPQDDEDERPDSSAECGRKQRGSGE